MILLALFFSCVVAGSLACSDDHCQDLKLINEVLEVNFLPNKEQLKYLCPKVLSFLECEKEYFECPGKSLAEMALSSDKLEATRGQAMLAGTSLVRDLCNEDSSVHRDYVANVACFRNYLETSAQSCRHENAEPIQEFFSSIYSNEGDASAATNSEIRCLTDALEVACIVDNLGNSCGSAAQGLVMEALRRMKAIMKTSPCQNVENAADLKARMLDFLELDDNKRGNFQSVLDLFERRR